MLHIPRLVLKQPMTLLNLALLLMLYGRLPPMKSATQRWQGAPVSIAVAMPTGNSFVLQLSSHSLRSLRSTDKAYGGHSCSQAAIYQAADLHKQPGSPAATSVISYIYTGIYVTYIYHIKMASLCMAWQHEKAGKASAKRRSFLSNDYMPILWA